MSLFEHRRYRVGVFVDNVNLFLACKKKYGRIPNHQLILKAAVADNELHRAIAYGVHLNAGAGRWAEALKKFKYETKIKQVCDGKGDWDTEITVDALRMIDELDMVVVVSGDSDFIPLLLRVRELGKVAKLMGVEGETSAALIAQCDEFVPIDESLLLKARAR